MLTVLAAAVCFIPILFKAPGVIAAPALVHMVALQGQLRKPQEALAPARDDSMCHMWEAAIFSKAAGNQHYH